MQAHTLRHILMHAHTNMDSLFGVCACAHVGVHALVRPCASAACVHELNSNLAISDLSQITTHTHTHTRMHSPLVSPAVTAARIWPISDKQPETIYCGSTVALSHLNVGISIFHMGFYP